MHGKSSSTLHTRVSPGRGQGTAEMRSMPATRILGHNAARIAHNRGAAARCGQGSTVRVNKSVGPVEQGPAIGAAAFQAGELAPVARISAIVEPSIVDARDE